MNLLHISIDEALRRDGMHIKIVHILQFDTI
jgi:hypothetical protein